MKNGEKPIANPYVVLREEFDDWAVLFNPDNVTGFGLNPTGVHVWKLLDGEHTLAALLEELRDHADALTEDASGHIMAFVDALVARGLATLDRSMGGPVRCSYARAVELSVVKPFTYEAPKLVNLNSDWTANGGVCRPVGSSGCVNYSECGTGCGPNSPCDAPSSCYTGNSAADCCGNGNGGRQHVCNSVGTGPI